MDAPTYLPPHDTLEEDLPTGYQESKRDLPPAQIVSESSRRKQSSPSIVTSAKRPNAPKHAAPAPHRREASAAAPAPSRHEPSAPAPAPAPKLTPAAQPQRAAQPSMSHHASHASVAPQRGSEPSMAPQPQRPSQPAMSHHASQASVSPRGSQPSMAPMPQPPPKSSSHPSASRSKSASKSASQSQASQSQSNPGAPMQELPPFIQLPNGGANFDPNALPLPPELAPTIYQWLRRLALQADLSGADKLLRDAFVELTSALSVVVFYPGTDGLVALGPDDEMPQDTQPIVTVAAARRAIVGTHTALVPVSTATECVGVVQLSRNPRQPAFTPVEYIAMAALAREAAGVIHHLVVDHLTRAQELKVDQAGLYRPEALEQHRKKGQEGAVAELSPRWVQRAYPMLIITILVASIFGYCVKIPTYSAGAAVVWFEGTRVSAPVQGPVDKIYASANDEVKKGDKLVKIHAEAEEAALEQATTQLHNALEQYLFDQNDDQVKRSLVAAQAEVRRAQRAVDEHIIRAPKSGVIAEMHAVISNPVSMGEHICTIVEPGTVPELRAFLPGTDRARLHKGMKLQVELLGYVKSRESAEITDVSSDVMASAAAKQKVGAELADSLHLNPEGSWVEIRAKLPARSFRVKGKTMFYHHGMTAKTEVRIEAKRFVVTLLPSLEKYVP